MLSWPRDHHAEAVNADADAARRGHAVFEGDESRPAGFVQLLLLAAGPAIAGFQRGALRDGIVLLGVAGGNFLAVDAALEDFDGRWIVGPAPAGLASGMSSFGRCVTNVGWMSVGSMSFSNTAPVTSKSS